MIYKVSELLKLYSLSKLFDIKNDFLTDFSRELADYIIYIIDVSGGDKIPRKGGPGTTQADLLVCGLLIHCCCLCCVYYIHRLLVVYDCDLIAFDKESYVNDLDNM